jgi:hypothetical protein
VTQWKLCEVGKNLVSRQYNACEHSSHGFASFKTCRHEAFGAEQYQSCEYHKTPAESIHYSESTLKALQNATGYELYNSAFWHFASTNNTAGMTCTLKAATGTVSIAAIGAWKEAFETLTGSSSDAMPTQNCESQFAKLDSYLCEQGNTELPCTTWQQYAAAMATLKAIQTNLAQIKADSERYQFDANSRQSVSKALEMIRSAIALETEKR